MSAPRRLAILLLIGMIIFVGLPLLGWGVQDISGFFAHPARLAYAFVTLILQIYIVVTMPEAGQNRVAATKTVQRQRLAVVLLQLVPMALLIVAPFSDRHEVGTFSGVDSLRYGGVILYLAGMIVMHWAEATLGKQFTIQVAIQEGHHLITSGPYRLLRHPRYLGIIIFNAGIALIFNSWLGLVLVAVIAGVLVWRIGDEEALMHQEFGAEWEAYAHKSWRMIPLIY